MGNPANGRLSKKGSASNSLAADSYQPDIKNLSPLEAFLEACKNPTTCPWDAADVLCHFANPDRHQNGMFALFHEGNTWQNDLSMYFLLRLVFFEGSRRVYQATRGSPLNAKSRGIFISKSQSGTYVFALQDVLKIAWNLKGNPVFEPYRSQRWRLQLVLF